MDWQTLLVTAFVYVSGQYKTHLWPFCQRMSNNSNPKFSDEELLTIFIYGIMQRRLNSKISTIMPIITYWNGFPICLRM